MPPTSVPLLNDIIAAAARLMIIASPVLTAAHAFAIALTTIALIVLGYKFMSGAATEHEFMMQIWYALAASLLIAFYQVPIPGVGSSVSTLFPDTANHLAGLFNAGTNRNALGSFNVLLATFTMPFSFDLLGALLYAVLTFIHSCAIAVTIFVGAYALFAIALITAIGPMFCATLAFPPLRGYCYSWMRGLLKYSLVMTMLAAYIFIGTEFVGNAVSRWPPFVNPVDQILYFSQAFVLYGVYILGCWKIPDLTGHIIDGTMHHGSLGMVALVRWVRL